MGIGRWVKRKARKAKNTARRAKDKVVGTAKRGAGAVAHVAEDSWKDTSDPMERLALKAERAIEEGMSEMDVRKMIREELRKLDDEVFDRVKRKVPELMKDELPKAMKGLLESIASGAMKPGLKKTASSARSMHRRLDKLAKGKPELIDAINAYERSIDLQVVASFGLSYGNFYTRALEVAAAFDRYANEGLKARRRDIIGFFRATGPDTVHYGAGGELSLGLQIGASYTESMPLELFLEVADEVLEELGVPE